MFQGGGRHVTIMVQSGAVATLIKSHQRFQNAEITVRVTQGSVSLGGTFHDPGDVLSLQHQVAEIAGGAPA